MHLAFFKFYPSDWRADPGLKACSLAARGLWFEMLAMMHSAEPRGHLVVANVRITADGHERMIAAQVGADPKDVRKCLRELRAANVFSVADDGCIISRRMVRDTEAMEKAREDGRKGGNPNLIRKTPVNPNG